MRFEMQLTVFTALLDPILRALTCLESSFSTPADVLLLTSAALGAVEKHLSSSSHGLSSESSVSAIRQLACKRFSELINESPTDVYATAFYLDPCKYFCSHISAYTYSKDVIDFRNTRLLRNINPMSLTVTLKPSDRFSSHAPTVAMMRRIGGCLFDMLRKEIESNPDGFVRQLYPSAGAAKDALRQQILLYGSSAYPFSEKVGKNASAHSWWKSLEDHPMSKLLAVSSISCGSISLSDYFACVVLCD